MAHLGSSTTKIRAGVQFMPTEESPKVQSAPIKLYSGRCTTNYLNPVQIHTHIGTGQSIVVLLAITILYAHWNAELESNTVQSKHAQTIM